MTKGNQAEQADKLARSGLAPLFSSVEIVAEKDPHALPRRLLRREIAAHSAWMIGNSPKKRHQSRACRRPPRRLSLPQRHLGAGARNRRSSTAGQHLIELDSFAKLRELF